MGASAWAASALTTSLEVPGYKAAHLYDFQNKNYDGTTISSFDDLSSLGVTAQNTVGSAYGSNNWYDDTANNHGIRLQSGGGRWIQFTVDIKADDYVIINGGAVSEDYEITMTDGTATTISSASNYLCFKADKAMSALKLTVHRYNYLLQILIMTKDETASTADYTINYLNNNQIISTTNGNDVIGTVVNAESSVWAEGVKYILDAEQTTSITISSGENILNVNVTEAAKYSFTVNATDGTDVLKELATGSVYAGESYTVKYPQNILSGEKLYNIANNSSGSWYARSVSPTKDADVINITYTESVSDVVFYTEGEDITGVSKGSNGDRASMGQMGYTANSNTYVNVTTLAVGKYKISMRGVNGNSAARTVNYKVGNRVVYTFSITNGTDQKGSSDEFTVPEANTTLSFACDGSSASGTDWFYIQKVGEPTEAEIAEAIKADKAARVFNIIGLGNDWTTDHTMTQSAEEGEEDIYTFTTTMNVVGSEEDNYFEYKLRQNSVWGGYQLPAGDNNQSWKDQVDGIGIYTLTFTADIANNTLTCEAVKSDFTYAVVGCTYYESTEVYSALFSGESAWNTAGTTDIMTKQADGTFVWKKNEVELPAKWIDLKVVAKSGDDVLLWFGNNGANVGLDITDEATYYVTVTFDGSNVTATAEKKQTYTVAGCYKVGETENASFFGEAWAPAHTANDMTRNDEGIYELKFTDVELTEVGTITYKVTVGNAWDTAYPSGNATWGVNEAGTYDITFTFNPTTQAVACNLAIKKEITDAGYATYCSSYGIDFAGAGLSAYIAKLSDTTVSFMPIDDAPANTGVLLKGEAGIYKLPIIESSTNVEGNAFVGTVSGTTAPVGSFVLMNGTSGVGFYKTTKEFTVGANTAYIPALASTARFIGFNFGETTAIEGVAAEKANDGAVYNLQGQRVVKAQKGLYIINGKKVLVK